MARYFVYIMASRSRTLYVGVTNDLVRRVAEHRAGKADSFTSRYQIQRLVFCERFEDVREAIAAEKVIKGWRRQKKVALIDSMNPNWQDLAEGWPMELDAPPNREF